MMFSDIMCTQMGVDWVHCLLNGLTTFHHYTCVG